MLGGEEVVKVAFGPLHFAARWVRQVLERTKRHMCHSKQLKPRPPNATDGKQPSSDSATQPVQVCGAAGQDAPRETAYRVR